MSSDKATLGPMEKLVGHDENDVKRALTDFDVKESRAIANKLKLAL